MENHLEPNVTTEEAMDCKAGPQRAALEIAGTAIIILIIASINPLLYLTYK